MKSIYPEQPDTSDIKASFSIDPVSSVPPQSPQPPKPPIFEVQKPISEVKKKISISFKWLVTPVLLIVLFLALSLPIALISYGVIPLNNPSLKHQISRIFFSIPLFPKTPEYVLNSMILTTREVKSGVIDLSIAIDSSNLPILVGGNKIDLLIKGPISYKDAKGQKFNFAVDVSKDLSFDIGSDSSNFFFRIRRIPPMLSTFLGDTTGSFEKVLNVWVYQDIDKVKNQAKASSINSDEISKSKDSFLKVLEQFYTKSLVKKAVLSEENMDDVPAYKIHYVMSQAEIKDFVNIYADSVALSNELTKDIEKMVKGVQLDIWVEKSTFRLIKTAAQITGDIDLASLYKGYSDSVQAPTNVTAVQPYNLYLVLKIQDINKDQQIVLPENAVLFDQYQTMLEDVIPMIRESKLSAQKALVLSDMNLLEQVLQTKWITTGDVPTELAELMPDYLSQLPKSVLDGNIKYMKTVDRRYLVYTSLPYITGPSTGGDGKPYYALIVDKNAGVTHGMYSNDDIFLFIGQDPNVTPPVIDSSDDNGDGRTSLFDTSD